MSDVQLRKKVQLKHKQEAPAVTLKRKGEAAPVITLKTKKSDDAVVGTAATAAAATATAAAAKAASNATTAGTASTPTANVAGVGANPAVDSAKAATGATGAGTPGKTGDSKKAGTTGSSSKENGGKAWAWILGVAAVAGLAFGGYKLATNNSNNDKSPLLADKQTEVVNGLESATTGHNSVADHSSGSASGANSETVTDQNRLGGDSVDNGSVSNGGISNNDADAADLSVVTPGSDSGDSDGGVSSDNSATANTMTANDAQNSSNTSGSNTNVNTSGNSSAVANGRADSSTGRQVDNSNGIVRSSSGNVKNSTSSTASSSNVTKSAVVSSVSDDQAVCLFAFDSSVVDESDILDKLATSAKNSGRKVVINAYADEVGTNEYNQVLSQRRANAVKDYFIKKGVDAIIIIASGKGETTQYATRAENRRADITIQ